MLVLAQCILGLLFVFIVCAVPIVLLALLVKAIWKHKEWK